MAVSLGAGGFYPVSAAPGPAESTIVNVTPARVLDTRDPVDLGLAGPFVSPGSLKLQITGSVPTTDGPATVVPIGATGVLLNVTAGSNVPNAVQVALPTAGADAGTIDITYDAYGFAGPTTDVLVDIVGSTTNAGLQEPVADVTALQSQVAALEAQVAPLVNGVAAFAGGNQALVLQSSEQTVRSISLRHQRWRRHRELVGVPPGRRNRTRSTVNLVCDRFDGSGVISDSALTAIFAPG